MDRLRLRALGRFLRQSRRHSARGTRMNWVELFFDLFRQVEPALNIVLNADSCREWWL
jgi:hypothetical protein